MTQPTFRILALLASFCLSVAPFAKSAEPLDLELIIRPDAHKTLVNPQCSHCVDEAKRRAADLHDADRVLAWTRGKYDGGAIPYRFFLVPYRVISDTYGVFVFDPDAGFARGYAPTLDFTFYGWRGGVMVMKHKDGTLYSTLSGKAFAGPRAGDRLKPVATITTDWRYWNKAFPGSVAYHMFDKYQPAAIPSEASQDSLASRGPLDPRMEASEEVLGIEIDGKTRAYRLSDVAKAGGVLADRLAGKDLLVLWYAPSRTAAAYLPAVEDESSPQQVSLAFDPVDADAPFWDRDTNSRFGIEGRAHDGPLSGKALAWVDAVQCRWFAWSSEHPQTEIFKPAPASFRTKPAQSSGAPNKSQALLIAPDAITPDSARRWRGEGVAALVAVLSEEYEPPVYERASRAAAAAGVDLFYWIEVARNRQLADAHPQWMASLGMHDDWRRAFPQLRKTEPEEVVKAYPWVPIGYAPAFDAHLDRLRQLLSRVPSTYQGLLINDLQGGPSSCGCGNLQCRWALDYQVPKTAQVLPGDDVAARWLARAKALVPGKQVIPVWITECEDIDLASSKRSGATSSGLCGDVNCAGGTCPKAFSKQWKALLENHAGPVGLLLTENELDREGSLYGPPGAWIAQGLDYLDRVPPLHGAPAVDHNRLWLVVQGQDDECEAQTARRSVAAGSGAAMIVYARAGLDQTYEPRILRP